MRSRVTFSIAAAVVLLASTNASSLDVRGSINPGIFSIDNTFPAQGPYTPCVSPFVCMGTGTNTLSWGTPDVGSSSSLLLAAGVTFPNPAIGETVVTVGSPFVIGNLSFTNRTTFGGEIAKIYLQMQAGNVFEVNTGAPDSHTGQVASALTLEIENTPNFPNPLQPDIIRILSGLCNATTPNTTCNKIVNVDGQVQYTEFSVFEGETATVQILGAFGSFDIIGLGKVDDPTKGFVGGPIQAVPEPSGLVFVGGGLIVLILARQRKGLRQPNIGRR
jgi:hypothetical protein